MYLTSAAKTGLIVAGTALLAVAGAVGWMHRGETGPSTYLPNGSSTYVPNGPAGNPEPVATSAGPVVYSASPFGSSLVSEPPAPAAAPGDQAERYEADRYESRGLASGPRPEARRASYTERRRRVVTRRRPLKHSVEIVGGSAAGGALIGGLAGGGKGAGIGALAGGAGGFLYDRLTRKKKVVVD